MPEDVFRILLIEDNQPDVRLVEEYLSELEGFTFTLRTADSLLAGLDQLVEAEFDVVLLDLSLPDSSGIETFNSVRRRAPATPIVVLSGLEDEQVALAAVKAGAQDFLNKGQLNPVALSRALRYAVLRSSAAPRAQAGEGGAAPRTVGVLGAKGGVGVTTVACHLAYYLRQQTAQPVLLVDLALSPGSAGFLMGADSAYSLTDLAERAHLLDAEIWKRIVGSAHGGVDIIPAPARKEAAPAVGRVRHVLHFARSLYRWVVLDLGGLTEYSRGLASHLDEWLLLTHLDVLSVFHARRLLAELKDLGVDPAVAKVVVNRATDADRMRGTTVQEVLGLAPWHAVPSDEGALLEAYTKGRLLEGTGEVGEALLELALRLAGRQEEPSRSLSGLLKKIGWSRSRQKVEVATK